MNSMTFDEYLAFKKTSRRAIREEAFLLSQANDDGVLLAVGSVAEGLGNSKSDLDLLMIPSGPGEQHAADCSWVSGDCIVDMQILDARDVAQLVERLDIWADEPWDVSRLGPFSSAELLLLHRLASGVTLSDENARQAKRGLLPDIAKVARLKLHTARHLARTVQVDMVGYRRLGDWYSLLYASQDLLGHVADGLLATFGRTNPNPKWRSRLLHGLPSDWAQHIICRRADYDARQAFWNMHYAPAVIDAVSALKHACETTTFGRAVFAWAECDLVHGIDNLPQPREDASAGGVALPFLELDVDFAISTEGVHIARLNEFSAAVEASFGQFELILRHDGLTNIQEALHSEDEAWALEARGLVEKIASSGLLLEEFGKAGHA